MGDNLLFLPLPLLAALLCLIIAALLLRVDLGHRGSRWLFAGLFVLFAFESLLVGLRFAYGIDRFIPLQRVLPLGVGPIMYLGFAALALPHTRFRQQAALHFGVALVLAVGFSLMANQYRNFDWAISASYLFYAVAIVLLARKGPDNLIHARLDLARAILRWMLGGAGLLLLLLVMDSAIALNFAFNRGDQASAMISFGSLLLILLLLAMLVSLPAILAVQRVSQPKASPTPAESDSRIESDARALLTQNQLYLDPDLTVQRLARRLHLPERSLSAAINQSQGMNVSQYVNGFRLAHAAELLRQSQASVASVMVQSGFVTRSNFYREFQRVYGKSPAQYRDAPDDPAT